MASNGSSSELRTPGLVPVLCEEELDIESSRIETFRGGEAREKSRESVAGFARKPLQG